MTIGVSETLLGVDELGAEIPSPRGTEWCRATYDVESAKGMVAASS